MRRAITLFATAGVLAGMVVLRRGPGSDQRRDHAQLIRRLRELHTEPGVLLGGSPVLGAHAQWQMG